MHSLEQQYAHLIETAKRLGRDPDPKQIRKLREELDQLDYELRISVPAGHRYYTLNMASREADASPGSTNTGEASRSMSLTSPRRKSTMNPTRARSASSC